MLIQINKNIVATAYHLILLRNLNLQMEAWEIISEADMTSSMYIDSKDKSMLFFDESPTQG